MANPTTNYGFVLPTPTDLVTDLPADFDVALQGVDTRLKALQPGTTLGDLAYSSATANTNTRLPIGTSGQVLAVSGGGVPAWTTTADVTPLTTKGDLFTFTTVDARIGVGANGTVLTADSAEATGLKWVAPASGSTFSGTFVYNSTDQSIANSTNTTLTWNTESFDVDGYHSTATNTSRFTIPTGKTGYFLFTANIGWSNNSTGIRQVFFLKNGTPIATIESTTSSPGFVEQSPSITVSLSAADYLEIRVWQNSGTTENVRNASSASITYLGA